LSPQSSRAAQWLAASGIQSANGGVARYYRADLGGNLAASTEITGYAASAFAYLHKRTNDRLYLDCAVAAARFLISAWNPTTHAMPFELEPPAFTYFFDCGIIVRGLLAVWRITRDNQFLHAARTTADAMLTDFPVTADGFAPILALPAKQPLPFDAARWSQSPGCYQLKAAMAWLDLSDATFEARYRHAYEAALARALATAPAFLPGSDSHETVMDRLHPFLYFLEGLLPRISEPEIAEVIRRGIARAAGYVEEIGHRFVRADVLAQLLRMRVYANAAGLLPLAPEVAAGETAQLCEFQPEDADPRLDGGFYFGARAGECIPHVSPVPTVFALQALDLQARNDDAAVSATPVI
jgi:hypothetical protein